MLLAIFAVGIGLFFLVFSANFLINTSVRIATFLKVSPLLIGLTIIAMGTSAPELFLSAMAAIKGSGSLSVGNVIGSNIFNLGFILGLSAVVAPIAIQKKLVYRDGLVLLGVTVCAFLMLWDQVVHQREGALLLLGLVAYNVFLWIKKDPAIEAEIPSEKPKVKNLLLLLGGYVLLGTLHTTTSSGRFGFEIAVSPWFIGFLGIIGILSGLMIYKKDIPEKNPPASGMILNSIKLLLSLALLVLSSEYVVAGAVYIAQQAGISEWAIGATIIAAGTSLPEIAATLAAIIKKRYDMGVGNVIGSDIFNILGIIGVSSVIRTLHLTPTCIGGGNCHETFWGMLLRDNIFSLGVLFITLAVTFIFMRTGRRLTKREGLVLFAFAVIRMAFEINPDFFVKLFGG